MLWIIFILCIVRTLSIAIILLMVLALENDKFSCMEEDAHKQIYMVVGAGFVVGAEGWLSAGAVYPRRLA